MVQMTRNNTQYRALIATLILAVPLMAFAEIPVAVPLSPPPEEMTEVAAAREEVPAPKVEMLRLALDLVDGSHVIGVPSIELVSVQTSYAKMDIPLKQIAAIMMADDHETASLELQNGDSLKGVLVIESVDVETVFGRVSVPIQHITSIHVHTRGLNDQGLVLHYSFDKDIGGKVFDKSGHKHHGSLVGGVTYVPSVKGKAVRLTSNRTYIISDDKDLNTKGWRQFSVSVWAMIKKTRTRGMIICRGELTGERSGGFHLCVGGALRSGQWDSGGSVGFRSAVATSERVFAPTFAHNVQPTPAVGRWYHLVGTYDGRTLRYYVNGKLDTSQQVKEPGAVLWDDPSTKLVIGNAGSASRSAWSDYYFDGLLDELQIWKRSLSEGEVREMYAATQRLIEAR